MREKKEHHKRARNENRLTLFVKLRSHTQMTLSASSGDKTSTVTLKEAGTGAGMDALEGVSFTDKSDRTISTAPDGAAFATKQVWLEV